MVSEAGQRFACGTRRFTRPPESGSTIGSAVSVDRSGPPAESADGAAIHSGGPDPVTWPPEEKGPGAGADAPAAGPYPTPTPRAPVPAPVPAAVPAARLGAADGSRSADGSRRREPAGSLSLKGATR
jgi:hypothetical protein